MGEQGSGQRRVCAVWFARVLICAAQYLDHEERVAFGLDEQLLPGACGELATGHMGRQLRHLDGGERRQRDAHTVLAALELQP